MWCHFGHAYVTKVDEGEYANLIFGLNPLFLFITPTYFWRPRFCRRGPQATGSVSNDDENENATNLHILWEKNNSLARTASALLDLVYFFAVLVKTILGSLSKDDGNGKDNARKQWSDWLNEENNRAARAARTLAEFFDVVC